MVCKLLASLAPSGQQPSALLSGWIMTETIAEVTRRKERKQILKLMTLPHRGKTKKEPPKRFFRPQGL